MERTEALPGITKNIIDLARKRDKPVDLARKRDKPVYSNNLRDLITKDSSGYFRRLPIDLHFHILSFCKGADFSNLLMTSCAWYGVVMESKLLPPETDPALIDLIEKDYGNALIVISNAPPLKIFPRLLKIAEKYQDYEAYDTQGSCDTSVKTWNTLCKIFRIGCILNNNTFKEAYKRELECVGSELTTGHAEIEDRLGIDTIPYYEAVKVHRAFYLKLLAYEDRVARDFILHNSAQRQFFNLSGQEEDMWKEYDNYIEDTIFDNLFKFSLTYQFKERDYKNNLFH